MFYISKQPMLLSRSLKEAFSGNSVKILTTVLLVYLGPFPVPGHKATALSLCFLSNIIQTIECFCQGSIG